MAAYRSLPRLTIFFPLLFFFNQTIQSQNLYSKQLYKTFISEEMYTWGGIIQKFEENENIVSLEDKLTLLNYYYGYIGYLLGVDEKEKGEIFLKKGEKLIEQILNIDSRNASAYAYKSAFCGWWISLDHSKAPILGPEFLIDNIKAYKLDSMNIQANTDRGNFFFYAPKFIGGDANKAVKLYSKAIFLMEQNGLDQENWQYFNSLILLGKAYTKAERFVEAEKVYEKMLAIEPDFSWVKDRLLPDLKKEM